MITSFCELKEKVKSTDLADFILNEQLSDADITKESLFENINHIVDTMFDSIKRGLDSDKLSNSKLSGGSTALLKNFNSDMLSPLEKKIVLYSSAVIEENARMGRIAACPTAGSSGIVPSVLISFYEHYSKSKDELIKSLIVAGEIGRIISLKMPLAGAIGGCQAECGAASAMAAGGACYMLGADIDTIFNAAALSLKNVLGLTCDPVAGLVEVPCVKRNMFLSLHSVCAVYLALSGIKSVIPFDDVVDALKETGSLMSPKLKESSEAGLSAVQSALDIKSRLIELFNN